MKYLGGEIKCRFGIRRRGNVHIKTFSSIVFIHSRVFNLNVDDFLKINCCFEERNPYTDLMWVHSRVQQTQFTTLCPVFVKVRIKCEVHGFVFTEQEVKQRSDNFQQKKKKKTNIRNGLFFFPEKIPLL